MQRIVADRLRGGHAFFEIARIEPVPVLRGPDAGVTIGLEFELYRRAIALDFAPALLDLRDLIRRAEQILDMMAEFVRDHIILREITLRAEAVGEFVEEGRVEINALVARAVERSHRALCSPAAGATAAAIEDELGRFEAGPEQFRPGAVGRAEGVARGLAGGVDRAARRGVGARLLLPDSRGGRRLLAAAATAEYPKTATEKEHHRQQHRDTAAAEAAEHQRQ